jgi:uncharacterized protein
MATTYKTPGVYIEEIPKFPPSIAPVATAIPAFIGYTEKALEKGESLKNKPTRIESIAEYVELFGEGPSQEIELYLDADNNFIGSGKPVGSNAWLLYDSLRMFYANGGGNCYIVSVGSYKDTLDKQDLLDGLTAVESEDEPTILLFPDAVNLDDPGLHDVQVAALAQCNKLMDRVTLCDTVNSGDFADDVQKLRDGIGINNLKYGAAYGPWINSSLPRNFYYRDLTLKRSNKDGDLIAASGLTSDSAIQQMLSDVAEAQKAVDALENAEADGTDDATWAAKFKQLADACKASTASKAVDMEAPLQTMYDLLAGIVAGVSDMIASLPKVVTGSPDPSVPETKEFILEKDITQYLGSSKLKSSVFDVLAAHYNYLTTTGMPGEPEEGSDEEPENVKIKLFSGDPANGATTLGKAIKLLGYADADAFLDVTPSDKYADAASAREMADIARNAAAQAASSIIALFRFAQSSAAEYEKRFNDALLSGFGTYKSLVSKAIESLNQLPPSGAIAGVYAAVDSNRGVWKAPANVSLNSVVSPAAKISQEQQADYNVDVNAGKSVNIIRSFTGKGVLVWGARTLAGNDNEWRYVNVRRLFNFVEESVKKATEQFVFEPNDANTWVRIQAMIENFLTVQWRQGALQGIKPEHAFYVSIGLGKTMTALDILEGRMIIEIGMAAVRPAEFIILRFSHKMAES